MSPAATGDGRGARVPALARALRWILPALLLASAVLTLAGLPELQRAVAAGHWPRAALALPPALLTLFILGYAVYRFTLVRAGRYPAGKALVQLALMVLVVAVVGGIALERGQPPGASAPVDLARALSSGDADVRAMAAELARHRPREVVEPLVPRLVELAADPAPEVRRQARASLAALAGADAGGDGPDAPARWRAYWEERGLIPR